MANLAEIAQWVAGIYQIEETDPVHGGPPDLAQGLGIANAAAKQLADRTAWLKAQVEALETLAGGLATPEDITAAINALKGGAPLALDTLNEIAAALDDDANHVATMLAAIATKADESKAIQGWTDVSDPDIDALLPGSTFGSKIEVDSVGHLVFAIQGNDVNDGLYLVDTSDTGPGTYDRLILTVRGNKFHYMGQDVWHAGNAPALVAAIKVDDANALGGVGPDGWARSDRGMVVYDDDEHAEIQSLVSGTTAGFLLEGRNAAHLVMGVKGNDVNDGFHIVSTGEAGDAAYSELLFTVCSNRITYKGHAVRHAGPGGGGPDYEADIASWTLNTGVSLIHGLSGIPTQAEAVWVCTVSHHGYAVGDEIPATWGQASSYGVHVGRTSWNLKVAIRATWAMRADGTTAFTINDNANWKLRVRAWL